MAWAELRSRSVLISLALGGALAVASCGGTPAPSDTGPPDAGPPPDAWTCTTDAQCDDGLFCDGAERCDAGHCVAGTVVRCDDMIDCTVDACSEMRRMCVSRVPDMDGDGHGVATCHDASGAALGDDCDDNDAQAFPGNREICDTTMHDEDCDPATHGAVDADGDGFEDQRCCNGTHCGDDCDDSRLSAHPGAAEICDLVDNNCNGMIDEGVSVMGFADMDHDRFGDPAHPMTACGSAAGFAVDGTDCDDTNPVRNPGQSEVCDMIDNDCDTRVDESASAVSWYRDADADGFGALASGTVVSCAPPAGGYVLNNRDCDDTNRMVSPGAVELCNGIDDDCNGTPDYRIAAGDLEDDDLDHYPDAHCPAPLGTDCDDRDPSSGPGGAEICDGRDNDCDTHVDEDATEQAYYRDSDRDGYGDSRFAMVGCTAPAGYSSRGGDCDESASTGPLRNPGVIEACNGVDDDCDVAVDEGEASTSCGQPNALAACVSGRCETLGCSLGYADCTSAPGCESDVRTDPAHCGSCRPCAAGDPCHGGVCGLGFASLVALDHGTGEVSVSRAVLVPGTSDVILGGSFTGELTLGSTTLFSQGGRDGFAARVRSDGSVAWTYQAGSPADGEGIYAIAVAPDGSDVAVGGDLCGPTTVCGGPIGPPVAGTCAGFWQAFGSATMPGCTYAEFITSDAGGAHLRGLAMEQVGATRHYYLAGSLTGNGNHGLAATAQEDAFVARATDVFGSQPHFDWNRMLVGPGSEQVLDLTLDGTRVVVAGTTTGSLDVGTGALTGFGGPDAFIASMLTADGTAPVAVEFGSGEVDGARRVVASGGTAYVVGTYLGSTPFSYQTATTTAAAGRYNNGFVVAVDTATLAPRWIQNIGNDFVLGPNGLAIAGSTLVASGSFSNNLDLGPAHYNVITDIDAGWLTGLRLSDGVYAWSTINNGGSAEGGPVVVLPDGRVYWSLTFRDSLSVGSGVLTSGSMSNDLASVLVTP